MAARAAGGASGAMPPATPNVDEPQPSPGALTSPDYPGDCPGPTPAEANRMQRSARRTPRPNGGDSSAGHYPRSTSAPAEATAPPARVEERLDSRAAQLEERVVQRVTRAMDAA